MPSAIKIFDKDLVPKRLIRDIELITKRKVTPGKTLLFLDEVQAAPKAIIALRYFYEECPDLHVIAAGSLLDFAIDKVGVPVGRVTYLHLYPMSFIEFLVATGRHLAAKLIIEYKNFEPISQPIHQRLLEYVAEYLAIGGMPEVVNSWCDLHDVEKCGEIQSMIVESYRQDFEKYCTDHQIKYTALIFENISYQLGKRFRYSSLPGSYRKRELEPCYDLLRKAKVINTIYHSDGQGIPLGAQIDLDVFKSFFVDVALAQKMLSYHPRDWFLNPEKTVVNKGELVECFVGQELLAYSNPTEQSKLYYWQRHQKSSNAEVDYLLDVSHQVIPVKIKSGKGTSMKSMRSFLDSHRESSYGIRLSTQDFSMYDQMHSYPLYAVANIICKKDSAIYASILSLFDDLK